MRRRTYLAGLAGVATLTGCLGGPGGSVDTPTDDPETPSPDPTDSGDHPVTPTDRSFQVTDRSCGQGGNAATVSFEGESVRVEGTIGGRDTCDTARLARVELHEDVLTVVVEVAEEAFTETPACAQCLTDIDYRFRATVARDSPARVRVVHRTADGESTVTTADRP